MKLNEYVTLGRSGLRVSPLCLGAMIFGADSGRWGPNRATARKIFNSYVELGGNFVDTADGYMKGQSEEFVGECIAQSGLRDQMVIATKYSFNMDRRNPNAGGNGRKNIYRALENSLRRLRTDYIDLYLMHSWDTVTPVEEVMSTLDALIRAGKVRYAGFSNVPAWYAVRAQSIAEFTTMEPVVALQLEYSLVERTIEWEHIPAAQALGIAVCPWGALANGLLSGKYRRGAELSAESGRLARLKDTNNPIFQKFTDRNWQILDVLLDVSRELGLSPAAVAINWVISQPGITSTIIGASRPEQFETALSALDFTIPGEARTRLDQASAVKSPSPYMFFEETLLSVYNGSSRINRWTPALRPAAGNRIPQD